MKSNNFPKNYLQLATKSFSGMAIIAMLLTFAFSAFGQRTLGRMILADQLIKRTPTTATKSTGTTTPSLLASAADLDQCANGDTIALHLPCNGDGTGNQGWTNGNVNDAKAHWAEAQTLPYRMKMTGLSTGPANVHTITIGYDITKNGKHALDYLTSFDNTETQAMGNNPCDTVAGCNLGTFSTFPIPPDDGSSGGLPVGGTINSTTNPSGLVAAARLALPGNLMTLYNGTISNVEYVKVLGDQRQVKITFTASASNPVLAWGAHIAWQGEWGAGLSAGAIQGSPYHMALIDLDGAGGAQDRQLSADAVAIPAKLTIVKNVPFATGGSTTFGFTPTGQFASTTFGTCPSQGGGICLTPQDGGGISAASFSFPPILTFGVQSTVAENLGFQMPAGWKVQQMGCGPDAGSSAASIVSVSTQADVSAQTAAIATLKMAEGESITCTFTNNVVTAAMASVSGRVSTQSGLGIRGAMVSMVDASTGQTIIATTNSFGYFTFTNVTAEDFYILNVSARRYTFSNPQQSFQLNQDLTGINFTSDQ